MQRPTSPWVGPIARRRFLAGAAACALPALLLSSRRTRADAVQRTAGALYAADFREPGLADREVLGRAFAAWAGRGGALHLEPGRIYDLGHQQIGSIVFDISGLRDATLAGNGATLMIDTTGSLLYNLLHFTNYRNLRIENLQAVDTGFTNIHSAGANFVVVDAARTGAENLTLDNVVGERLVSFLQIQGQEGAPRVRGIHIVPNCRASHVFYAFSCLNQGDDVTGGYTALNCGRSYFPYGVARHDLTIRVHGDEGVIAPEAETSILIKSYDRPTSGIRLDVTFTGALRSPTCVSLENQPPPAKPPSVIEDVDLRITVEPGITDPFGARRLVLRSYRADGTQETGHTGNIWRRIRLGGDLRSATALTVLAEIAPATPVDLTIASGTLGAEARNVSAPGIRIRRLTR
jgi:hypothetical protein